MKSARFAVSVIALVAAAGAAEARDQIRIAGSSTVLPHATIVGGLVLTLMTLPRIIISTRAALKADPAFVEGASGAIIVLLVFLLVMTAGAILLRRLFERRW